MKTLTLPFPSPAHTEQADSHAATMSTFQLLAMCVPLRSRCPLSIHAVGAGNLGDYPADHGDDEGNNG
jgi:hypothetical protein